MKTTEQESPTGGYKRHLFAPDSDTRPLELIQVYEEPDPITEEEGAESTLPPAEPRVAVPAARGRAPRRPWPSLAGWWPHTVVEGEGRFRCPTCRELRPYRAYVVRQRLHVLGIPLFSSRVLGRFVSCTSCRCCFEPSVATLGGSVEPNHLWVARRLMVRMMMADGEMEDAELTAIKRVYGMIGGGSIKAGKLVAEARNVASGGRTLQQFLEEAVGMLDDYGRRVVLQSGQLIAEADGSMAPEEQELLWRIERYFIE